MILYVLTAVVLAAALLFAAWRFATAPKCVHHEPREDWDAFDYLHCRRCGVPLHAKETDIHG